VPPLPGARKVQTGKQVVPGPWKKFTKPPLAKLKVSVSGVATRLPLPMKIRPPVLESRTAGGGELGSFNCKLKEVISEVKRPPMNPSVVIVPVTEPGPTGTFSV